MNWMRKRLPSGLLPMLVLFAWSLPAGAGAAAVPCVSGLAGIYPCRDVNLMARLPLSAIGGGTGTGNDIWGWTDPLTGREYALVGMSNATAFVDVTDPENPVYLGRLQAPSAGLAAEYCDGLEHCEGDSQWRDLEVYSNHAFIVSEQAGHGLVVFDLTQLRNVTDPPVEFTQTARYTGFGNAHTVTVNTETGFLYANGTRGTTSVCGGSGGPVIIDVRTPANPVFAGCDNTDGYTHDSQCVIYHGPDTTHQGKEICMNSNEDTLTINDVTNKLAPARISRTGYPGSGYTHQGWLTPDHRFFLLDDELDEQNFHHNTKTYIWDVSDLDAPQLIGTFFNTTAAIDHNQFIHGNYAYQSNYRAGLRILETQDVASGQLREVAFFDVYPADDLRGFNGTWSNYPFFASGTVVVNTIENASGLFILRPTLADLAVSVTATPDPVTVGGELAYTFTLRNQGPTHATGAALLDALPAGVTFVSATPSQGTCAGSATVTCSLGVLTNGASATVVITIRPEAAGALTNTGVVNAVETDTRLADNTATATTTVQAIIVPEALTVDAAGNGVFQPNETVAAQPRWRNTGIAPISLTGALSNFTGPAGPTYNIVDGSADYGTIGIGASAICSDCYSLNVTSASRPVQHWDATVVETVTPTSTAKTWRLHLGDSFTDVPASNPFYRFVETIFHKNITAGCGGTNYCPTNPTTREQMAVFVLLAKEGSGYTPPACGTAMFGDVPASSPFCPFIEELARRGVVAGCGGGNYCPTDPVSREQMAVFTLVTLEGSGYTPPACGTPMFGDVPASSPFCPFIEELARRGVVAGCGSGLYCPAAPVTREQMSVFLTLTFSLTLYGP